jgi:phthalate 4,5-dioxygenase oxygenase subunit
MLSKEDNEVLCRVGAGTPMGEVFRRFWLPALLASELPAPDSDPLRLRLLGEDLVAFRDTTGRVGIIAANCPHRGASLFFGRNEEAGLRCVYHGWKFNADGTCVDMPNEPAESDFRSKVKAVAYPAREYGDLIWVYMGPPELEPELPQFEWATVPSSHRHVSKWYQDTNWAQGMEGEIDTSHVSFLHRSLNPSSAPNSVVRPALMARDGHPKLVLTETDYGFTYGARRDAGEGNYYWRVTQWLLPMYSLIPSVEFPISGRAWVPIDDEHTWTFGYTHHPERPFTPDEIAGITSGAGFPPRLIPGTFMPAANRGNDYLIDRQVQRTQTYTGIWGINEQDRALQEWMGPIYDRSQERLGTADVAVIAARRILLKMARALQEGKQPLPPHRGDLYRVRPLDIVEAEHHFERLLQAHTRELSPAAI